MAHSMLPYFWYERYPAPMWKNRRKKIDSIVRTPKTPTAPAAAVFAAAVASGVRVIVGLPGWEAGGGGPPGALIYTYRK
jgi:hypothetical protein